MRISDWSSDVCSSDLGDDASGRGGDLAWPSGRARIVVPADLCGVPRAVRRIARRPASGRDGGDDHAAAPRSEEHTSELQSLMRISYAVFCLKKKNNTTLQSHRDTKHTNKTCTLLNNLRHK